MDPSDFIFERAAIIGTGLIGGSMGMAMRRRKLAREVVGIGRRTVSVNKALDAGACDTVTLDIAEGLEGADFVVLATPIRAFEHVLPDVVRSMEPGALLTDVASSKRSVIKTIRKALNGRDDVHYLSTHPMAGSEKTGPCAAREDLFEDCVCIFTPLPETGDECLAQMRSLWDALGAKIREMEPATHDRLVAHISHVPHLVAAALVDVVDEDELWYAGGGLIDTTRVASSDPALWCDIYESNSEAVCDALDEHIALVERMKELVRKGDFDALNELLATAKEKRDSLLSRRADFNRKRKQAE